MIDDVYVNIENQKVEDIVYRVLCVSSECNGGEGYFEINRTISTFEKFGIKTKRIRYDDTGPKVIEFYCNEFDESSIDEFIIWSLRLIKYMLKYKPAPFYYEPEDLVLFNIPCTCKYGRTDSGFRIVECFIDGIPLMKKFKPNYQIEPKLLHDILKNNLGYVI